MLSLASFLRGQICFQTSKRSESSFKSHFSQGRTSRGGFPILAANGMQFSEEPLFFSDPQDMHKGLLIIFSYFLQNTKYRAISIMGQRMCTYTTFHYPALFLTWTPNSAPRKKCQHYVVYRNSLSDHFMRASLHKQHTINMQLLFTAVIYVLYITTSQFQRGRNTFL